MHLYERFEIPDECDWSTGRPAQAKDTSLERDVFVYRGIADSQSNAAKVDSALRIRDDFGHTTPDLELSTIEIFTSPSFLWIVTPQDTGAEPFVEKLRQAGVLPNPLTTVPWVTPHLGRCPRCQGPLNESGTLCAACTAAVVVKPKGKIVLALISTAVILSIAIWIAIRAFQSGSESPIAFTAEFSPAQESIVAGNSAVLNWKTQGASSVAINQGIGSVPTTGSRIVMPQTTTTYILTAVGRDSKIIRKVTVNVLSAFNQSPPKPTPFGQQVVETPPAPKPNVPRTAPTPEPEPRHKPPVLNTAPQEQRSPSTHQPPPQKRPEYVPPAPDAAPHSGELHCPNAVPPSGQVVFENLPAGVLQFDREAVKNWSIIIRPQSDGRQRLILVSRLPITQDSCTVKWTMTR